jgi:CHAT domain-containing protein/tetratricopeptide (TPR) repeat protein
LLLFILISLAVANRPQTTTKPSPIRNAINQATTKLNQNKPEEAVAILLKIHFVPSSKEEEQISYALHFLLGDCYSRMNSQKGVALQHYKEAKKWAAVLNDNTKLGEVNHKIGVCLIDLSKPEDARKAFNLALQYKIQHFGKENISLALEYNGIGNSYLNTHAYDKALENYKKALSIGLKENKNYMDNAMFYQNIAIVYTSKGDYDNAYLFFNKSVEVLKITYGEKSSALTMFYLNLGVYFYQRGKPKEALAYYYLAEPILKSNPSLRKDLGVLYLNEGNIATSQKDFNKALTYYQQSLKILKDFFADDNQTISTLRTNISYIFENQGNYSEALSTLMKIKSNDPNSPLIIKVERNIAGIYDKLGKFPEANKYYQSSIKEARMIPNQETEYAYSLHRYGEFLTTQNRDGLPYLNEALKIIGKNVGKKNQEIALVFNSLGTYYTRNNSDYKKALAYYQQALISIEESFSSTNILSTPSVKKAYPSFVYFDILQNKTFTLMNWYRKENNRTDLLRAAMNSGEQALVMLDKIRDTYGNEETKYSIRERSQQLSLVLMQITSTLYSKEKDIKYIDDAFRFSEKSRSAVMLSYLREVEARQAISLPTKIQALETKLKTDISDYQKFIYDEKQAKNPDRNKIDFWENKLFQINQKHDSLIAIFEQKYPAYYSLKYDKNVISSKLVAEKLNGKQAFIEYYLSDSVLFSFVITKDVQRLYKIMITQKFRSQISSLRNQLTENNYSKLDKSNYDHFVRTSRDLYNLLLKPFNREIEGKDLIIVPDGELLYIPFDILLSNDPKKNEIDFRSLPYLIKNHAINYSLSATIQFGRKEKHVHQPLDLAAFAPTYNQNHQYKNLVYNHKDSVMTLLPIPGAKEEVGKVSQIYKGTVFEGDAASEKTFKAESAKYNILHLSAHTIIDNDNPMYSKLVFSPINDKHDDGLLNTYELFNMKLGAELAVLSACNTGNGRLQLGEGIISIARGFFYAGVPGVVMTLWSVEDASSAQLMELFYKYLHKGLPKDEALRQAKLDFLSHCDQLETYPYFWAGYVNIGDNSPLEVSYKKYYTYLIIGVAFIFLLALLFYTLKKKK